MPTPLELAVPAAVATVCAVVVVLLMHAIGFGDWAPVAGGVAAGVAATSTLAVRKGDSKRSDAG